MIQIITDSGKKFDLPEDLVISVEENSVMTGKQGSFSLPIDLPWSNNNVQLIGYPNRHDRARKFTTKLDVTVSAGVWVRRASLHIISAQRNVGISGELYFAESKFYQEIDDVTLPDIFKNTIRDDYNMYSLDTRIRLWLEHFEKVQTGEWSDDFLVFPVCAKKESMQISGTNNGTEVVINADRYMILNRPDVPTQREMIVDKLPYSQGYDGSTGTYNGKQYYKLAARKEWTMQEELDEDAEFVTYPKGYGATPFLKLEVILHRIFQYFGYNLIGGEFYADSAFQNICYINNTADAIMDGQINYAHLVPDKTVAEFMEHVENSFGCEFVFDEVRKTVTPVFWKDILAEVPENNLDHVLEDYPKTNYSPGKNLQLRSDKSKLSEKLLYNTYNELFSKYRLTLLEDLPGEKFCRLDKVNLHYKCYEWRTIEVGGQTQKVPYLVESVPAFLDYGADTHEPEDRECGFLAVPQIRLSLDGQSPPVVSVKVASTFSSDILLEEDFQFDEDSVVAVIPFIDSIRHKKTIQIKTGTDSENNTSTISEEQSPEDGDSLDIIPCFFHGLAATKQGQPNVEKTFFASQYGYGNTGLLKYSFDLDALGLYNRFWKLYDEMIRTSFHEIVGPAQLSLDRLMTLKKHKPYRMDGQSVLPAGIQYEISDSGVEVVELKLRTLKDYL